MKELRSLILGIFIVSFISIGGMSALAQGPDTKIDTDGKIDYSYCELPFAPFNNGRPWVSPNRGSSFHLIYFIRQPTTQLEFAAVPQVNFLPGDIVEVKACGCASIGGSGKTWKRYVSPSGPNSDKLYHGLISVPNAAEANLKISAIGPGKNLVRISDLLSAEASGFRIKFTAPATLVLGYEDNKYTDNSYRNAHDNGTQDQCKDTGQATVEIKIVRRDPNALPQKPVLGSQ